jgi:predicted DsbA family dithiol-disulfide isomerase
LRDKIITAIIEARRLIHYAQENGQKGSNFKVLDSLYKSYLVDAEVRASMETLLKPAKATELDESES